MKQWLVMLGSLVAFVLFIWAVIVWKTFIWTVVIPFVLWYGMLLIGSFIIVRGITINLLGLEEMKYIGWCILGFTISLFSLAVWYFEFVRA